MTTTSTNQPKNNQPPDQLPTSTTTQQQPLITERTLHHHLTRTKNKRHCTPMHPDLTGRLRPAEPATKVDLEMVSETAVVDLGRG
jgi:hypothetical protein